VDFKKNLYWIVLAAIVLFAVLAYPMFVTDVEADALTKRNECDAKVKKIHDLAVQADKPDAIKTEAHVAKAKDYRQKVDSQIKDLDAALKQWKINTTFKDQPPTAVLPFDDWLNAHREELYKQLHEANVAYPETKFNELTFKDSHTTDTTTVPSAQRPYRIKRMAIVEEVLGTLVKKPVKQDIVEFQRISTEQEVAKQIEAGVLKIDALTVTDPDAAMKAELDHINDAYVRSGRTDAPRSSTAARPVDLPYMITTVDLDIVLPFAAVPAIVKNLENSEKYHAVITKLDVTRAASPFPRPEDVVKPGPETAQVNTYYREGPVKASISFDIYEYDTSKAAEFAKAVSGVEAAPAPAAGKKKSN
jgi:hypothetical protein